MLVTDLCGTVLLRNGHRSKHKLVTREVDVAASRLDRHTDEVQL